MTAEAPASSSGPGDPDLAGRIGEWALGFSPSQARLARIRASIRDFAGCVAAGARRPELEPALGLAHPGDVAVWGSSRRFDPAVAAMVCATAGALLQLHDFTEHAGVHASSPVISAALAARHGTRCDPEAFVHAIAAGYETVGRIGTAAYPANVIAGSTPTATVGALGAVVAAALVRGLDAAGVARALRVIALSIPFTPWGALRAHAALAPLHSGFAARAAYEAAWLAEEWDGGAGVLEGDERAPGLLAMLQCSPAALSPGQWDGSTLDQVAWKFFRACFSCHTPLEAMLRLPRTNPDTIERVVVTMGPKMMTLVELGPGARHLYDRLMSVRWVLARALERGTYDWMDAVADDDSTFELARRIELIPDPALDALLPNAYGADVEVWCGGESSRTEYRRSTDAEPATAGPRGWTTLLDEEALELKFEGLTAEAPGVRGELEELLSAA